MFLVCASDLYKLHLVGFSAAGQSTKDDEIPKSKEELAQASAQASTPAALQAEEASASKTAEKDTSQELIILSVGEQRKWEFHFFWRKRSGSNSFHLMKRTVTCLPLFLVALSEHRLLGAPQTAKIAFSPNILHFDSKMRMLFTQFSVEDCNFRKSQTVDPCLPCPAAIICPSWGAKRHVGPLFPHGENLVMGYSRPYEHNLMDFQWN